MALVNETGNNNSSEFEKNKIEGTQFCGQCGKLLQAGQKFCSSCGSQVAASVMENNIGRQVQQVGEIPYLQKVDVSQGKTPISKSKGRLIDKFRYSKGTMVTWIVAIVGDIILLAMFWSLRVAVDSRMLGGIFDVRGMKSMLMSVSNFLIIITLVEMVICFVKIPTSLKMCLSIFEDGISGVAGKNFYFMSEAFEIQYSDILNVKRRFGVITIETTTRTYKCVVERPKEAFRLLQINRR